MAGSGDMQLGPTVQVAQVFPEEARQERRQRRAEEETQGAMYFWGSIENDLRS